MVDLTSEQRAIINVKVTDGRGRTVPIDGVPAAVTSDATVATVGELSSHGDGSWDAIVLGVLAGEARIVVTADADVSPAVQEVIGELPVVVTLDPRTTARLVQVDVSSVEDKPN